MATPNRTDAMCPVCYDYYEEPKDLQCTHSFCKKCLIKLYHSESRKQVTCLLCHEVTSLKLGNISKLPTNTRLKELVLQKKSTTYICTNCEENDKTPAVSYCQTCGDFMCQSCHDIHSKWKKYSEHDHVSINDIKSGKVKIRPKCSKHSEDTLSYVCKMCKKYVCFKCRMLECEKLKHDVIDESKHENEVRSKINEIRKEAEIKMETLSKHTNHVKEQVEKVKNSLSVCKHEIEQAYENAVARLAERKNALLRECEEHESLLLEKLDKLMETDHELVSSLSNACELVSNGVKVLGTGYNFMEAHDILCNRLRDLLKTNDPDLSEATAITTHGESLYFNKKQDNFDLGEIQISVWKEKICVKLSKHMVGAAPIPVGRMAVGYYEGGIEIYSAEGELQQTVLEDVGIYYLAFLSDGRCVVRDKSLVISLYAPEWAKLDVRFETLNRSLGCLAVDCNDLIYVGEVEAIAILIFTSSGGNAIREIPCDGYIPVQISVMESRKMLVVMTAKRDVIVVDQQGKEVHSVIKDGDLCAIHASECENDTILIAAIKRGQDRVTIKQYTSELKYMRTLNNNHAIEKYGKVWCYLREFSSGKLALCINNRLYIFHKTSWITSKNLFVMC